MPAGTFEIDALVAPLLQAYVYGAVPPDALDVADPVEFPKHATSVLVNVPVTDPELPTVIEADAVHEFEAVTLTV